MYCARCNRFTDSSTCPECGHETLEQAPHVIYWCDTCRIPLIHIPDGNRINCPVCENDAKYLCADLRPVFPEERLLLEVLEAEPYAYIDDSVWANGSKYYVRGIRESGKDNNTVGLTSFSVTQDQDYVVAYGLLGNAVAYTIRYLDEDGNELAPSETYYGNVGDKPVVAYLYIDGYQPRYYNLTRTLGENAADNVFDFVYTRVVAAQEPETPTPAPSAAPSPGGTTQPQESAAPTEPGETTSPTEPGETTSPTEPGETTPPTEPGGEDVPASSPVPPAPSTDPGAVTSPDDTSNPDQTEPIEIGDLDVPLAEFDGEDSAEDTQLNEDALRGAEGPDRLRIFAVIFGIVLAVAVVVSAFWYFLTYRKKRKNKQ